MGGPDDDTKYTVAVFDADQHSGVLRKTHGNSFTRSGPTARGSNITCAAPGKAKMSYVPPMPLVISILTCTSSCCSNSPYVDEVRFDRHVNGGQAWRRNNRVKEIIQNNPLLEPVAVNYMQWTG